MAHPAEFSMLSLMALVPPVLTPVGTQIDQDLNPKPLASPTIGHQGDCANPIIPELQHIQLGSFNREALQRPRVRSSWRSWSPVGPWRCTPLVLCHCACWSR